MNLKLIGATALTAGAMAFGALGLASPASAATLHYTPPGNSHQDQGWNNQDRTPPITLGHEDNNCYYLPELATWNSLHRVQPNDCFPFYPAPRPPVYYHSFVSMNEQHGTYYTGALVTPGEQLVYNHVTYTVKAVTPVFHGIHTGQSIVTFYFTAGLPQHGDTFVTFTTGHYRF